MKEDFDEELPTIPNNKYQKFFDKFIEIETINIVNWKTLHILAYFCKKYKEAYNINYTFKFNTPSPAKCFEVWQIKALSSKLSSNPKILKEYIDWIFDNKIASLKSRFRSVSFLTKDENANDYKMNVLLASQTQSSVNRSTPLPVNYVDILNEYNFTNIKTYGDLSFAVQIIPPPENFIEAMQKLAENGFDKNILNKII